MHVGHIHQDSEATAFNANRKHQIVLNMEVKRIDMEKKMRERYFSFEMSLVRARRLKIIERQKSLGIYRPRTMENAKELRKGAQTTSVFFTQSVAMDSKVTLPPVLQQSRTTPALPSKPEGKYEMLNISKNFNNNKLIIGREQAKRIRQSRKGLVDGDNGLSQHKRNEKPPKGGNRTREAGERKTDDVEDILKGTNVFSHEHGIVKQSVDCQNPLPDKDGRQLQATRKDSVEERKAQKSEQNISHRKCDTVQNESKQISVQDTSTSVVKPQSALKKLSLSEQRDLSAARAQNVSTFSNFEELRGWHDSMDPSYFADDFNKFLMRSKSATAYRKNTDAGLKVRPKTAQAKLTIQLY